MDIKKNWRVQNSFSRNPLFEHVKDDDLLFIFIFGKSDGRGREGMKSG